MPRQAAKQCNLYLPELQRVKAVNKLDKGAGVNVAVIDTGIDLTHPDLAANIVGGTNCSQGGKRNYGDGNGHGTHVAGIIGANGFVKGVAPGVTYGSCDPATWIANASDSHPVNPPAYAIDGLLPSRWST